MIPAATLRILILNMLAILPASPQAPTRHQLAKAAWLANVNAYYQRGTPLIDVTWRLVAGKPEPEDYDDVLKNLERRGQLRRIGDYVHPTPTLEAAPPCLDDPRKLQDAWHEALGAKDRFGLLWETAREGERLPFKATLAMRSGEITDDTLAWAQAVCAQHAD